MSNVLVFAMVIALISIAYLMIKVFEVKKLLKISENDSRRVRKEQDAIRKWVGDLDVAIKEVEDGPSKSDDLVYPVFFFIKLNDLRIKSGVWKIPVRDITYANSQNDHWAMKKIVHQGIVKDDIVTNEELSKAMIFAILPGVPVHKDQVLN
jgi:hypothetical protein